VFHQPFPYIPAGILTSKEIKGNSAANNSTAEHGQIQVKVTRNID
jgi:hypothetical protein